MSSKTVILPDEVAFTDDTEGSFRQWAFAVFMSFLPTKKTDMSSLIATPPRNGLADDYDADDHADYSAQAKVWTLSLEQQADAENGVARNQDRKGVLSLFELTWLGVSERLSARRHLCTCARVHGGQEQFILRNCSRQLCALNQKPICEYIPCG
jgi:hypothetical protein